MFDICLRHVIHGLVLKLMLSHVTPTAVLDATVSQAFQQFIFHLSGAVQNELTKQISCLEFFKILFTDKAQITDHLKALFFMFFLFKFTSLLYHTFRHSGSSLLWLTQVISSLSKNGPLSRGQHPLSSGSSH